MHFRSISIHGVPNPNPNEKDYFLPTSFDDDWISSMSMKMKKYLIDLLCCSSYTQRKKHREAGETLLFSVEPFLNHVQQTFSPSLYLSRQFFMRGVSLFWGRKRREKRRRKGHVWIQLHQYYEKDAKNPHHSSRVAIV